MGARSRVLVHGPQAIERLCSMAAARPTYGHQPLWALLRRERLRRVQSPINARQVYRTVKAEKLFLQRDAGAPPVRVREGKVSLAQLDLRHCSDGFEIGSDNSDRVRVMFSFESCDNQAIASAATPAEFSGQIVRDVIALTFSNCLGDAPELPHPPEWLSNNGSGYIAQDTRDFSRDIGLLPRRTPYRTLQNKGPAEAFLKTFKPDHVSVNPTPGPQVVLKSLTSGSADYNVVHPNSTLGYRSPENFSQHKTDP